MDNFAAVDELISFVVAFFVPIGVSYIKGNRWTPQAKHALSILISVVVAAATSFVSHAFVINDVMTLNDWAGNALIVFSTAIAFYELHFKYTPTNQRLERKGPFSDTTT
jgi:putative effector of murein hydrolase LrgA (UPF0299 family)